MLGARSVAVVGASARPGSFGERMALEALRSPGIATVHPVNPAYARVLGLACVPTLEDLPEPVDLVLLGVSDERVVEQLALAGRRGDGGAVVFGSALGLDDQIVSTTSAVGLAVCGSGCMGFVNVTRGVRAIGYVERHPLAPGPIAVVTHSGSMFSALLRTRRRLEFSVVVSSGREVVTTTADYLTHALSTPETRVVGLVLETMRDVGALRAGLAAAAERDVPVVALTVGSSPTGRELVGAHSGAVAGDDAAWEALFDAHGVHRVDDLDELADTLELFAIGRRVRGGTGIATLHDSGAERVLVADVAHAEQVPFAVLGPGTEAELSRLLDPGLLPGNPLDVWGRGVDTRRLFGICMQALADDDDVSAVALGIDLVEEYDGDDSYPLAVEDVLPRTDKPVVVLSNLAAGIDPLLASRLRDQGVPVLEGTRTGLRSLRHLLDQAGPRPRALECRRDEARQARWRARLAGAPLSGAEGLALLGDYGLDVVATVAACSRDQAMAAAAAYPVVLKTDEPGIDHRTDAGGVLLGLDSPRAVAAAYDVLAQRLGPRVLVQPQLPDGVELALGVVSDPALGPLLVVAAGGTLVEVLQQRVVALPPVDREGGHRLLARLPAARVLDGVRGALPADREAVVAAVVGLSQLAVELGDVIGAVDVNPLVCGPNGAVAVDALVIPRTAVVHP